MTGKPEKDKPAAAKAAENTEAIQKALDSGEKVVLPPIHVYGQHPEPEYIALAKIRCECLRMATEATAYDQRPRMEKAQEMYDWVVDPANRIKTKKPHIVETKPVDYSQANLPEEPVKQQPAAGRAGGAVDWSGANT